MARNEHVLYFFDLDKYQGHNLWSPRDKMPPIVFYAMFHYVNMYVLLWLCSKISRQELLMWTY